MKVWIGRVAMMMAAVTLASCGSDGDVDDEARRVVAQEAPEVEHRVAVDPGAIGPPGTEIASRVEVVAGSSLVGPTFPLLGWTDAGEQVAAGWQAVVVVDADPVGVWNGYVRQLGIDDRASGPGGLHGEPSRLATAGDADPRGARPGVPDPVPHRAGHRR